MNELKLFAVMLGGNPSGAGVEVHDVVFAVGNTLEATREQLRASWFAGGKPPHVDSWMMLDVVDGMRIVPADAPVVVGAPDLWHVNLGYYEKGDASFFEGHENLFVIATSADEAKVKAKQKATRAPRERLHTDALHRVSDRLAALGSPYRIQLAGDAGETQAVAHDGYLPFLG